MKRRRKLTNVEMWDVICDCLEDNDEYDSCAPFVEKLLGCDGGKFTLRNLCYWWNPSRRWIANYLCFGFQRFWAVIRATKSCTRNGGEHYKISRGFREQLEQILRIEYLIGDDDERN